MNESTADSKYESKSSPKSASDRQRRHRRLSSMTMPNPTTKDSVVTNSKTVVARLVAEPQHTASRVLAASQSLPSTPVRPCHFDELTPTTAPTIELKHANSRPPSLAQYGSGRRDSGTSWSSESGAVSPKRRKLNKAFRTAEDEISSKDAQIAALQQELLNVRSGYERSELKLRQDLLLRHLLDQERAERDHEREHFRLKRVVNYLEGCHHRALTTLMHEHQRALAAEYLRTQDALCLAVKDRQEAQDREIAAFAYAQTLQSMVEHTNTVANTLECDLVELQRLDNEEAAERHRNNRGEPPSYESLQDMRSYRTPYEANRNQDAGAMTLDHVKAVIRSNFMRDLAGANRSSLALREYGDESQVSGAGFHLFHTAMLAFVTACMQLNALLDRAVEGRLDLGSMHTQYGVDQLPSWKPSTVRNTTTNDKEACIHPADGTPAWEPASENMPTAHNADSRDLSSIVATADIVAEMIYDLCTHIFAALDVREYSSEQLCNGKFSRLGVWLRVADDTLLKALKHRLEAEPVFDLKEMCHHGPFTRTLECSKCESEHCGGYCTRLHMIGFNITKLKALRRSFDRISSPDRIGEYLYYTYQWLEDTLEHERQIAAYAAMPPTRQVTPVMSDMATPAMDDAQTAAEMSAIRLDAPAEEVAWPLQDVPDRHHPRLAATNSVPLSPVPLSATTPAEQDHSAPSSSTYRRLLWNAIHPVASSSGTRTRAQLSRSWRPTIFD